MREPQLGPARGRLTLRRLATRKLVPRTRTRTPTTATTAFGTDREHEHEHVIVVVLVIVADCRFRDRARARPLPSGAGAGGPSLPPARSLNPIPEHHREQTTSRPVAKDD